MVEKLLAAEDGAEYLEEIGMDVERLSDGKIRIQGSQTEEGEPIYITVRNEDVFDIIQDVFGAGPHSHSVEDVFDEYVIERQIGEEN